MSSAAKYGMVVLLDALGARTASLHEGLRYLATVKRIRRDVESSRRSILLTEANSQARLRRIVHAVSVRFFADSILLTCPITRATPALESFTTTVIGMMLTFIFGEGIKKRILFRGAATIGHYIEEKNVVLGPAIIDVANWYEKLDLVGVMATPKFAFALKRLSIPASEPKSPWFPCSLPVKSGPLDSYALDWFAFRRRTKKADELAWFYRTFREFEQPLGTEAKYHNTEALFLKSLNRRFGEA